MNLNDVFFKEGFFAVTLGLLGTKLENVTEIISSLANLGSVILAAIAIFTFIRKERKKKE